MLGSCLFFLFKFTYIILTILVLLIHGFYMYQYIESLSEAKAIFNHNQLAHFMGMFLGFLFRTSGMLSAGKEKIGLTCTYFLFLLLILLLSRQLDIIFSLHAVTAVYAVLYVLVLKYRRHKQRQRLLRHQVTTLNASQRSHNGANVAATHPMLVAVDLTPGSLAANVRPSAPPLESLATSPSSIEPSTIILNHSGHVNPNYDPNYPPPINHTPPPSYTELFETKQ